MDVRAKQRLSYQWCLLTLSLRGGGFASRHLNRYAPLAWSSEIVVRIIKTFIFVLFPLTSILYFGCNQVLSPEFGESHLSHGEKIMELEETSMNFDTENVLPFLRRIKPLVETGFSDGEISQVQKMLENLKVEEEKELEFSIQYHGEKSVLQIKIFMDDIDSPDLYFYSHPKLIEEIDKEFEKFADELGI